MRNLKCILLVCALTLAFLKVSMRVCGVCMEHIACHLGHFTPLRDALQSICQRSTDFFVRQLWVQYIAPWDFGNSATMSLRNLHVYHGGSYGSHRISIYTAHRRSLDQWGSPVTGVMCRAVTVPSSASMTTSAVQVGAVCSCRGVRASFVFADRTFIVCPLWGLLIANLAR